MAPSTLYADERTPPDDATRLRMFLDTVDAYKELQATFPLPTRFDGTRSSPRDYWTLVMHLSELRKFYAGDHVALKEVVRSVRHLYVNAPAEVEAGLTQITQVSKIRAVPVDVEWTVNGNPTTFGEVVEVELYGRHLHADPSKWEISLAIRDGRWDWQLALWCVEAARTALDTAALIRRWSQKGLIDFDAPAHPEQ